MFYFIIFFCQIKMHILYRYKQNSIKESMLFSLPSCKREFSTWIACSSDVMLLAIQLFQRNHDQSEENSKITVNACNISDQ